MRGQSQEGITTNHFTLTAEAQSLYQSFYRTHNQAAANESGDPRAFLAKAEQLPLRLALILHHIHLSEVSRDATRSALPPLENSLIAIRDGDQSKPHFVPSPACTHGGEGQGEGALGLSETDWTTISAPTMQSAITLTSWFIAETMRVYVLLTADPKHRLALELESWITTRGGKTTEQEIKRHAPEKFRTSPSLPYTLLQTLQQLKRGAFRERYLPILIHFEGPQSRSPTPDAPIEFHLTKKAA